MTSGLPFRPNWLSPPGATIEDALGERGWTQAELAERLDMSAKHVSLLVHGKACYRRPKTAQIW